MQSPTVHSGHTARDFADSAASRLIAIAGERAGVVAIETAKAEALLSIAQSLLNIEHLLNHAQVLA